MKIPTTRLIYQRSVASLGVVNNLILIFLIVFKSPKHNDALFVIIIHKNLAILSDGLLKYANFAFCSLFGMSMVIFAIHFVYRYLIIIGSGFLRKRHFQKVLSFIGFTVIVGFLWALSMYWFLNNNVYSDIVLRKEYLAPRHLNLSDIDYVGAHFWQIHENGTEFINWKSMGAVAFMTVIIFISFSIVFYCGYQIYTRMEIMSSIQSAGSKNLQSQLFWALVFQTLIPVFLMHVPASIGFITSMFNQTNQFLGEVVTYSIFMYPALDPLPNFFIIKSFRQAILDFFGCLRKGMVPANSKNTNSQKQNSAQ
ncbi:unnamed protein product [Caenorhabditis nigoni]